MTTKVMTCDAINLTTCHSTHISVVLTGASLMLKNKLLYMLSSLTLVFVSGVPVSRGAQSSTNPSTVQRTRYAYLAS